MYLQLLSERDELNHLLNEIQKQKEDVLGASQQMNLKFSSTEAEVHEAIKCTTNYSFLLPLVDTGKKRTGLLETRAQDFSRDLGK